MRKIAAILLLLIFVFNLFGYRLFVSYMVNNVNQSLEAALDRSSYDENELVSIKKPINLPYYNNTKDFTRAYGDVEMNGILYKYVKSRIYNDSLEMLCIPNKGKQQLLNTKDNFTQAVFDLQKDSNKKTTGSGKVISHVKLISEYENCSGWNLDMSTALASLEANSCFCNTNSGTLHKATVEQPPDTLSKI